MTDTPTELIPRRRETLLYVVLFGAGLFYNFWAARIGAESLNLPGVEFRQAQTAISAYYIQKNQDFALAYPTPVLGKPWSIPMEFPLYQWTVVGFSNLSGWNLTQAGRAVSQLCFYLCLPAFFLLLGRMGVAMGRRFMVLALLLTCPLYIFYSRAFLIETMALMFSLWFWVAFEFAVEKRSVSWWLCAVLAGSGAGLVKVTTFMLYLLPVGWWAIRRLGRGAKDRRWRGDITWMASVLVVPFAATLWWLHFADATKALNPSAQFIREANMRDFNFGTWADHLSPELWRLKWSTITDHIFWGPLLAGGLLLGGLARPQRRTQIMQLLLWFCAALVIFPVLYARHDYYFIANGVLLLLATGLAVVALAESGRPAWLIGLVLLVFSGGQIYRYLDGYFQTQRGVSSGGDGLSASLNGLMQPDEIFVMTGQDWNSMTPYYARRRALMIRPDVEENLKQLDTAFAALADEKIGALVLGPATSLGRGDLIRRAEARGIDRHPVYRWRDFTVYLPGDRRGDVVDNIQKANYDGVVLIPVENTAADRLADDWFEVGKLTPVQQNLFSGMNPVPLRFFSSYGPAVDRDGAREIFGMHPVTRLVFFLEAGQRVLTTEVSMPPDTYDSSQLPDRMSDGVQITLIALVRNGTGRTLYSRVFNPRDNPDDRGLIPLKIPFSLEHAGEVELFFGPGPAGRDTHDSISIGRLQIK